MDFQTFYNTYHMRLDAQQQAAVQAVEGPVLLLAVPGSGKTTTLLARLGYLVLGRGVPPRQILTTTYTVAATNELRQRFAAQFGGGLAGQMEFRTINGVCSNIIRAYERQGHTAFELVSDEGRLNSLLGELYRAQCGEFATEADLRTLRTQITCLKNRMVTEQQLAELETSDPHAPLVPIYRAYRQALRIRRWMDYDDQMVYALAILRQQPELLRQIRARYRYFCVDEAQDTSRIQHTILSLLAAESRNLFLVGDEDQSIYGFRAACPEALLDFEKNWPGARVLLLERNYRSTPQIVSAADRFIRLNTARRPKQMTAAQPDGPAVEALPCPSRTAQYAKLAELAAEANRTGCETAVLYRDNESALPIIDLLARQGIPYRARGSDGLFFSSRIVRDITDILHLAYCPGDGDAFLRVYYKLGAGISRLQAQAAVQAGGDPLAVLRRMELPQRVRANVQDLQLQFRQLTGDTAAEALDRITLAMGYGKFLEDRHLSRAKLEILQALARQEPTAQALLARLPILQRLAREDGTAGSSFVLSTIHSSKGLEYDRVILADVVDGVLPQDPLLGGLPTEEELAALEEDRRLFYVGMTRARRQLTVVTFTGTGIPSAFGRFLFPPPKSAARERGLPQPQRRPSSALLEGSVSGNFVGSAPTAQSAQTSRIAAAAREFFPGARVIHRKYGPGVIARRVEDTVTIRFDRGRDRTFLLTAALSAGALRLESF